MSFKQMVLKNELESLNGIGWIGAPKGVVLIRDCFQNFHLVVLVVPRNTGIYSI